MPSVSTKKNKVEVVAPPEPSGGNLTFKILLIILAGFFIYAPAFHGGWLWDDDQEITANSVLPDKEGLKKIWAGDSGADYFPLKASVQWGYYRVVETLLKFGIIAEPQTGWHLLNVVLHIVNALLIWRLLSRLGIRDAWIGGMLFCIHPILVESVAWVSELKNTLSLPFLILSMLAYLNFDERGRLSDFILAIVCYAAAILCKTSVVMFPFVILLYAWWRNRLFTWKELKAEFTPVRWACGIVAGLLIAFPLSYYFQSAAIRKTFPLNAFIAKLWALLGDVAGRVVSYSALDDDSKVIIGKFVIVAVICAVLGAILVSPSIKRWPWPRVWFSVPFFVISLAAGLLTIFFQFGRAIGTETIPVGGFDSRLATAGLAILFYLSKCILPIGLLPIYPRWDVDPPRWELFLAWPLIIGVLVFLWTKRNTWGRHMLFGLGFFLITLVPILGFITMSYMRITWVADHFVYLSIIGLIGLVTAGASSLYHKVDPEPRRWLFGLGVLLFAVLVIQSHWYAGKFANEYEMWTHTLNSNPNAWQAHSRLGKVLLEANQPDRAFHHIEQSVKLRPDLAETHNNYGAMLEKKGDLVGALEQLRWAQRIAPDIAIYRINLGSLLVRMGRYDEGAEVYNLLLNGDPKHNIEPRPNDPTFLCNYGVALYFLGRNDEAIDSFQKALKLNPDLKDAKENLAAALKKKEAGVKVPSIQPAMTSPGGNIMNSGSAIKLFGN